MDKAKEIQLAKAGYNWLKASPILTVFTLFFVAAIDIGYGLCGDMLACNGEDTAYINYGIGILISAAWHLLLLQYVNNPESEFVRMHGQRALTQAGIRTGVAFFGIVLDWLLGASGVFACLAIVVLLIIWTVNATQSKRWVEGDNPPVIETSYYAPASIPSVQPTTEEMDQTLNDLQSSNDVIVLKAIEKLAHYTTINDAILKTLELLADENDNMDIRMDARVMFNRLKDADRSNLIISEGTLPENETRTPAEILNELYQNLQSDNEAILMTAIASLKTLSFSSEAIRHQLEKLSLKHESSKVRAEALAALNSSANRTVQRHVTPSKLDRVIRYMLLQEVNQWESNGLLDRQNAEVIRRRYDFDLDSAPQTQPQVVPVQAAAVTPKATPAPASPPTPPAPRPSLLQTLTSEASIKIYLYLGAFFVIAAAAILGAVVPELRLPILLLGTFIFGGLSIVIKKRLPQPSFALFIVFSFLLTITANSLEESLRIAFDYSSSVTAGYWVVVFLIMTAVWSGGTWLYESRLFSITAFGALALAFLRIGDIFDAQAEFYVLMVSLAALAGLGGVWLVKKWRDEKFALPLFIAVQALQGMLLIASISIFGVNTFDPANPTLWHLASFMTWGLAAIFFILSNGLYPFFVFPWLAAGTLIPMPLFLATAFDLESLGSSLVLSGWGIALAILSEGLNRFERVRKYGLPTLLASMPPLALGLLTGFAFEIWLGLVAALSAAMLYAVLHLVRNRWWLWTLSLLNGIIAYFAFFNLEVIQRLDIFLGYPVTLLNLLFLLPDLFLKKDWQANLPWRLPLRIYGVLFTVYLTFVLPVQDESGHVAVCYFLFAVFFAVYALAYRKAILAYLPTAYLPLAILFALDAFDVEAWLPTLVALAVVYFVSGIVLRAKEAWSFVLRNSALILGGLASFAALMFGQESGGWFVLVIGLLFAAEMYLRKNGWLEVGAPVFFSLGALLILLSFDVERIPYHLLIYSLIWLLGDMLAHLTFAHMRPLKIVVRLIGGLLTCINYGFLFGENNPVIAAGGFAIYALLFLTISLLYRQPNLFYAFTLTLPLFVTFLFRSLDVTQWIHPVIVLAVLYYAAGFMLRKLGRAKGWDTSLLYSGLGLGVIVSLAAPILGGLDASLPVAVAATLWAAEAFAKRNAWLAFPANGLYLLAYFIILFELNVDEPQFFSIGTALFGLIQHYLLTRSGNKTGTFLIGMFSQFVLLGTTYLQLIGKSDLMYFFLLFLQSMVVLVYGLVIRSRSLTFFPIGFVVLGVVTVVYSALKDIGSIFLIGCTGIILLMIGILAVLLRERIAKLGEHLSDWGA